MSPFAITFAGQGSQSIGMMAGFTDAAAAIIKRTFEEASDSIHTDLWDMVVNGPVETLTQTVNMQATVWVNTLHWSQPVRFLLLTRCRSSPFVRTPCRRQCLKARVALPPYWAWKLRPFGRCVLMLPMVKCWKRLILIHPGRL